MKAAAYSWEVGPLRDVDEFYSRYRSVVEEAAELGVNHLVFPESFILHLAVLFPDLSGRALIERLAEEAAIFEGFTHEISIKADIRLVAGSHFVLTDNGLQNLSLLAYDGAEGQQIKNVMTQFESVEWGLTGHQGVSTLWGCATLICYDVEFPEAARAVCEAGAEILNVPAYTETRRGFQRVRWCAQARAIENQVFVIHASLTGQLGREPIPTTYGTSAILCPSVTPFPESAILAETDLNKPGFAIAELDFEMLMACREQDDVRNWHDRHASDWRLEQAT